jgi:release factor glutamine methyltransferase
MTLHEAQVLIYKSLQESNIESFVAESQHILESLEYSSLDVVINPKYSLSPDQEQILESILERRITREPLQHILGCAYFYGLKLKVTPDVLIPRPETERLVEIALETIKDIDSPMVLDIGTGSGAIALALKHERPDIQMIATDISSKALELASFNAQYNKLEITFIKQAHLIVANLPYLPSSDKKTLSPEVLHDPDLALYSGEDGLELFRRLLGACTFLKADLLFELDPRNIHQAYSYSDHWQKRQIYQDLAGRERFLYLARRKSSYLSNESLYTG